jgi:putative capsular polysaccharide synthesis protein
MKDAPPILVWTMGKVGTSTVSRGLKRAGIPSLHMHSIRPSLHSAVKEARKASAARALSNPADAMRALYLRLSSPQETGLVQTLPRQLRLAANALRGPTIPHIEASLKALEIISSGAKPVKIISMVREPVGRNISAFFENLDLHALSYDAPTDALVAAFKERYSHNVPLEWFDRELKDGVGFDVFAEAFDREARLGRYTKDKFEFLIMRSDTELARQQDEVSDFVGRPVELTLENTAEDKPYGAAYRAFKDRLSLPEEYVRNMYSSKFARHFWTGPELDLMTLNYLNT